MEQAVHFQQQLHQVSIGIALEKAITDSISYVQRGIKNAPNLGSGNGPLMHFDV